MPTGQFNDLRNLCFRYFKRVNAADPHSAPVYVQHNLNRLFALFGEKALQHMDDELHGRVVVVQNKNFVERRLLGLGPRLGRDPGSKAIAAWRDLAVATLVA